MASKSRIYYIKDRSDFVSLVRATSPSAARSYMAREEFSVRVATQDDIVLAIKDGAPVQEATEGPVQLEMGE